MENIAIFRINYKSDFILTLNSDAGWLTPFCIKFWTGAPSQAYFVGFDGTTYTHCAPVDGEPTKLLVQFDDHHLPIGDLKFQIGYHFTAADFPTSIEDEVINQAAVIINNDGEQQKVMLDFNGETAPEIEFSLPAYANEAQRIANESQRIANEEQRIATETQRIANEEQRISQEQTRQQNEGQRIVQEQARVTAERERFNDYAKLKVDAIAATDAANSAADLANEKAQLAADEAQLAADNAALAQSASALATEKAQLATDKAALAQSAATLANEKAALAQQKAEYATAQGDYAKAQGDYAKAQAGVIPTDVTRTQTDATFVNGNHDPLFCLRQASSSLAGLMTAAGYTKLNDMPAAQEVNAGLSYDVSVLHPTSGVSGGSTYASLSAALAVIPQDKRKGGMTVKFVQSSDNKYVQYRLMANAWSTTVTDWQGVDDIPIADSDNLVKSGGVFDAVDFISLKAEKDEVFAYRLLKNDGTYVTDGSKPCIKTTLYCDEVSLTYNLNYAHGYGYCACWITDETGNTMVQGFDMDVVGYSGTIKIQKPDNVNIWYLVWVQSGTLILTPKQDSERISYLEEKDKEDSKIYYVEKVQQVGEEYSKYVDQNGNLATVVGFGSNKFTVTPGLYNFKTTMPANSSVSLWAAYKGSVKVVKGSLTSVSRNETVDLSFYDIDTIYISWTTGTKSGAVLTKINSAVSDNNSVLLSYLDNEKYARISDDTVSPNYTYSSKKIEDSFVGLVAGKNIFNKDVVILDKYINTTNGKTIKSQEGAWYNPEYIQVLPSQDYTCNKSGGNNYFIFYDENENKISSTSSSTFTTPNNAKFLRVTGFAQSHISTLQIEKGNTTTAYEPYQLIIPQSIIQATLKDVIFVDLKIVDKQGTYGFTSINSAVAAVQDGGVVLVMPGEYEEAVFCKSKEVHIIGFSRDKCVLFNTLGDYYNAPLYQSAGSLKNMTVWSKWDSTKDYSEITTFSYAIHIDNYGDNKKYSIENCHLISDFSNTLGCGARPNHVLMVKDCLVEHTNAYKEAFPSSDTGGSNCMNMHGGGNESIMLINNVFISKTTDLQFVFGEGNTDVFKLLCVNNAIKTVGGLNVAHFDIQDRSYGNLNVSLDYTT